MDNRLILAQQIPLEGVHPLDGGCGTQYHWNPPVWEHGFYRVYFDGKLVVVTQESHYNSFRTKCADPKLVQVFAEAHDVPD